MAMKKLDDHSLIKRISRQDNDALGELYDRYAAYVHSLAIAIVGDRQTAEEITQDVFVRVWQKAHTYNAAQAKVSTWLMRIARNRAIDKLRSRNIRPEGHRAVWEELSNKKAADMYTPEAITENKWERIRIRHAVAALPADQRDALAMAFFHGYSHNEIANALEESLGTIKTRIRLAMQKLREELSKDFSRER